MHRSTHYIAGTWRSGSGEAFISSDPATGEKIWEGNAAQQQEIELAVEAARHTQPRWSKLSPQERISYLEAFGELLEGNKQHLAATISKEVGKPLWESLTEVTSMIGKVALSVQAFKERCPLKKIDLQGVTAFTRHKPHGILAVFGPYNFPGHLPNGHIIPALLAGNAVIFKPSEFAPLVAQETMKLWEKTGIPAGVIQLLQGGKESAIELSTHPALDGLLLTGSWIVGNLLTEKYASLPGKILVLELGGNNPLVVFHSKNLMAAAYTTILSSYLTAGQRCTCARRLIIPTGSEGDAFVEMLVKMIHHITVAPYTHSPEPFMGPLISAKAATAILKTQQSLVKSGATAIVEAQPMEQSAAFVTPGLIDVTSIADRKDEEYFGPLLQLIRVESFDQAIEEANNTAYGLVAGLLSDRREDYEEFYDRMRAGVINWNTPTTGASSAAPFGGVGKSGNFHPSAYYAADYCSYPVASLESEKLNLPSKLGIGLEGFKQVLKGLIP